MISLSDKTLDKLSKVLAISGMIGSSLLFVTGLKFSSYMEEQYLDNPVYRTEIKNSVERRLDLELLAPSSLIGIAFAIEKYRTAKKTYDNEQS